VVQCAGGEREREIEREKERKRESGGGDWGGENDHKIRQEERYRLKDDDHKSLN